MFFAVNSLARISPERSQAVFPVVLPVSLVPVPVDFVLDLAEPRDDPPAELPLVAAQRNKHHQRGSEKIDVSYMSRIGSAESSGSTRRVPTCAYLSMTMCEC